MNHHHFDSHITGRTLSHGVRHPTEESPRPAAQRAFDLDRTSGGSSGGAAAIIEAGGSPLAIGSDTGASIRLPAHFCGIASLKATAGRVPRTGHIINYEGVSQFLTHIGPLARRVDALALVLGVIAGPDGVDPHLMPEPLGDPASVQVAGLKVGHFTRLPPLEPTADTAAAVQSAVGALSDAGCSAREIEIPESDAIFDMYMAVLFGDGGAAEASARPLGDCRVLATHPDRRHECTLKRRADCPL